MEFRESQLVAAWVWVLMGLVAIVSGGAIYIAEQASGTPWIALAPTLGVILVLVALMRMTTEVDEAGLKVVFGFLPVYTRRIAFSDIGAVAAETYDPLREFGGWGIRGMGKNRALTMQGNQGVRITLKDGSRLLVGSAQAEEFARVLRVRAGI